MLDKRNAGPAEQKLALSEREDLQRLCHMGNSELLQLINSQLAAEDAQYDSELLLAAQELLDERAPLPEELIPDLSLEEMMEKYAGWFKGVDLPPAPPERKPRRLGGARLARGLIAAVILIAALLSVTALASQKNPIQYVVDKGEQLVRTISQGPSGALTIPEGTDTASQYSTLEEALEDLGAENAQRITWIPERFSLNNVIVQTTETSSGTMFLVTAHYTCGDDNILYNISYFPNGSVSTMEMNPGSYELMVLDGVEYDIVQNNDMAQAQWFKDEYSYLLISKTAKDELKIMLLSLE